jgi:hypothetical protein
MVNGPVARHPDDDLLADLVADALPVDAARAVENHVLECQECASLLADAEHVRELLARPDPGPIPAAFLSRIEEALRVEAQGYSAPSTGMIAGQSAPAPAALSTPTTWSDTDSIEAYRSVADRETDPFPEGPSDTEPHSRPSPGDAGKGPRLSRPSRGTSRSRRDIRQEIQDLRTGRRGVKLAAVAGVVVVLALSGVAIRGFFWSSSTEPDSVEAGTSVNVTGSGSRVVTTGTEYTSDGLSDQARQLMQLVADNNAPGAAEPQTAEGTGTQTRALDEKATGNLGLRDPSQLDGCLTALHAGSKEPVAVDLATYDNQEAAVIILLGEGGGYEVWVVARTCSSSSDETMRFLQLPA